MIKRIISFFVNLFKFKNVYFIGSTDKLPEPLSKDDEVAYVLKSMDGDLKARSKLIEHTLRLVVFLA